MIDLWRKHFVLAENMLEMECTCLTPEVVLKTSGHVDRFTDLMVKDLETGECFRADKMLEDAIDDLLENNPTMPTEERENHLRVQRQADAYSPQELDKLLLEYGCKAANGQPFSPSFPFNLMFKTSIGPEGTAVGYLRPETAQGLFVNFRRLLDMNAGKMPFAAAQIGLGFRNGMSICMLPNCSRTVYQVAQPILTLFLLAMTQKLLPAVDCFVCVNFTWEKLNTLSTPMTSLIPTLLVLPIRSWSYLDVTISWARARPRPFRLERQSDRVWSTMRHWDISWLEHNCTWKRLVWIQLVFDFDNI